MRRRKHKCSCRCRRDRAVVEGPPGFLGLRQAYNLRWDFQKLCTSRIIGLCLWPTSAVLLRSLFCPLLGQGLAASCRVSLAFFQTERPSTDVGARGRAVGLSLSRKETSGREARSPALMGSSIPVKVLATQMSTCSPPNKVRIVVNSPYRGLSGACHSWTGDYHGQSRMRSTLWKLFSS